MKSHRLLTDDVVRELDARRASLEEADEILAAIDRAAWTPEVYHGRESIPWGTSRPKPRRTIDTRQDAVPPGFEEIRPEELRPAKSAPKVEAA